MLFPLANLNAFIIQKFRGSVGWGNPKFISPLVVQVGGGRL